jgi:hypothetical protein
MYYLKRTDMSVPAPVGLVDKLTAFRSESFDVAMRAAESFKAEHGHNIDVESRTIVSTTQTLDEAMRVGVAVRVPHGHAGSIMDEASKRPEYAAGRTTWPEPGTMVVREDGSKEFVRVGDHSPEPFVAFHKDRV